jgi:glycosyltransferase involved in cell wall biosynthesis
LFKVYFSQGSSREPDYETGLRARAQELGLNDHVHWVHDVSARELPALYATVDALVNYPEMDGFPVLFLEAAAARKPVISRSLPAYDWGFARHFLYFVASDDIDALASEISRRALESGSPDEIDRLEVAWKAVTQLHDERVASRALLECYESFVRR